MTFPFCRVAIPCALFFGLTGCIEVGPDYKTPAMNLSSVWSGQKSTPVKPAQLAQWWKRFNDPVLDNLVEQAVRNNNDVALAKARIREVRASYKQTGGAFLPSVDGTGSATRAKGLGGGENTALNLGFNTSWELDLFGANRRSIEAARYGLDAEEENMHAVLVTLIGDITSNYVQLRGVQANIALTVRTVASQRKTAALTRERFNAGDISAADLANAEGQTSLTEAGLSDLNTSYAQNLHRLSVLAGLEPAGLTQILQQPKPIPAVPGVVTTGVPADLLLNRPDLRVAERNFARSTALVGRSEAALYPSVSLTGNISMAGNQIGDLGKGSTISWGFGPSLTVPIFRGGQLNAAVEGAKAARDQSFISYRKAILAALEEVENASVALNQHRTKYVKLQSAVRSFRKATDLSRTLYQGGSTSFLDLLTAERSLYGSEQSLIQSRIGLLQDYINLQKALGGGWDGVINSGSPVIQDGYTGPHLVAENPKNSF
ncbi:efflux transporter outer membrane subunit (plasmid) [Phyllobacterium sp. 628]|uniref:efflux transporter outer membrane subunit n=1 Tax=Phyllobacterium sp. 628 TaxID=2718938 RepID=UPI0016624ED8|nr:efflux transporter outer membrane subunit [Phyllobacterium sp. 628]QND54453.1 efflux transporter outer membrane subunit [Phyllobacterium sp. 628]